MRSPRHVSPLFGIVAILCGIGAASFARADLAHGTPQFTCTPPTQQIDTFLQLTPIPATGGDALKEIRWYVDAATVPKRVTPIASGCTWQTLSGEIGAGAHVVTATAVNNNLQESARSNPLNFTVPAPVVTAPNAPTAVLVQ